MSGSARREALELLADLSDQTGAVKITAKALRALLDVVEAAERVPDVGKVWSRDVHQAVARLEDP